MWFDGHADFNTSETTTTGFSDGMGLAIAVGHCWKAMAAGVPGFRPVAEENVMLAGAREIEPGERRRLSASEVTVVGADSIRWEGLRARVGRVYVHLDLDVLDPEEAGRANEFAPKDGLGAGELEAALGMVRDRFAIAAAGIASYDPALDVEGGVLDAALVCARLLTAPVRPIV